MIYINPIWFYLLNVAAVLRMLSLMIGFIFTIIPIVVTLIWLVDNCVDITDMDNDEKKL